MPNKIKTFEMTGSPKEFGFKEKEDFVKVMKSKGYKHTAMNEECSLLVTDDLKSKSTKMTKAKKLGIRIATYGQMAKGKKIIVNPGNTKAVHQSKPKQINLKYIKSLNLPGDLYEKIESFINGYKDVKNGNDISDPYILIGDEIVEQLDKMKLKDISAFIANKQQDYMDLLE